MTNDKATRQAIYGALLRHVDKFGKCSDIQKTIDAIIDRLSELQPVNKTDEELEKKIAGIIWDCSKQWENAETDAARQILALLPSQSDLLTVGEILEDGNLCNVVKAADLNDTLKSVRDEIDGYKSALGDLRAEFKQGNELVKVKSAESELVSLNAFILMNLPSGITEDYDFPSSTSRATIKRVMGIIRESNERFMVRVRRSIAISNAQPK